MKAVTWQAKRNMIVEEVPDPIIQEPHDIIIKVTSSGLCGSDLHLYEVMGPFMKKGDIVGHEPMGIVQEVGKNVKKLRSGDRVVIPFNIACGHCWMCTHGLQSQCETTQVREHGRGAALFGYSMLYGEVPGGQAEYLRVPYADYGAIKVPDGPPDDRFVFLSDVLPTAWQAVEYASVPDDGTVIVFGLGPIGDMSARIAKHKGAKEVIGVDLVSERLARAEARGIKTLDIANLKDDEIDEALQQLTGGRGGDSVIDAVGMEAHGSPVAAMMQSGTAVLPDSVSQKMFTKAGVDRLNALHHAIRAVRRGGTVSLSGVYAGQADPMPMDALFDKQIQVRMGQANVRRWTDDIMPLLTDADPLGVDDFATHHMPLSEAPRAYEMFQKKQDGAVKILFQPFA